MEIEVEYLKKLREQFVSDLEAPEGKEDAIGTHVDNLTERKASQRTLLKSCISRKLLDKQQSHAPVNCANKTETDSGSSGTTFNLKTIKEEPSSGAVDVSDHLSTGSHLTQSPKSRKLKDAFNIMKMRCKEQKEVKSYRNELTDLPLSLITTTRSERSAGTTTSEELRKLVHKQCKQLGKLTKQFEKSEADLKREQKQAEQLGFGEKYKLPKAAKIVTASGRSFDMAVDEIINSQTVLPLLSKLQYLCLENVQQTVDVLKSLSKLPKDISDALRALE